MVLKRGLIALLAAVLVTGCAGRADDPEPVGGTEIEAEVVSFSGDAYTPPGFVSVSDHPVDLRGLAGWFAVKRPGGFWRDDGEPRWPGDDKPVPDVDGKSYVVAGGGTGCRLSSGAELYREGDDLRVRFTGGQDRPECFRPYAAVVQFAVPEAAVAGARTVLGDVILPGTGPGRPVAFVPLGTLRGFPEIAPAELAKPAMYDAMRQAGAMNLDQVKAAVQREPRSGSRSFAFVLTGCAETGAVLLVSPKLLTADLTGGEGTVCDAAAYFLATFEIDSEHVPAQAVPAVR
jgi:hypothetical protein